MCYTTPTLLVDQKTELLSIVMNLPCIHRGFWVTRYNAFLLLLLFFTLSRRYCDWSVFFQRGLCNSLYQPIMMLSAFKDSILFQNLAALRAQKKIFKNSQTMPISAAFNMFVRTCMSVNIAGIQCQKMKSDTWDLELRKMILEHVSGKNSHVSNKSCFYLHVLLDIVAPGVHRSWSHLKWYKSNSY